MPVVREQRRFQIGNIGVARASEGGRIVGQQISSSANQIAEMLFEAGARQAQQIGEERAQAASPEAILTIDPTTGAPQAFQADASFGSIATDAYQNIIRRRYTQSLEEEIQSRSRELAVEFENHPNAVGMYEEAMSDYIAQMSNVAQGEWAGYIQNFGTHYLNQTRTNLGIAQIRRERAAAAAAQRAAFDAGLNSIESAVAQGGPTVLQGDTVVSATIAEVGNISTEGNAAGLPNFSDLAVTGQGREVAAATARGLVRYAAANAASSDEARMIQHAIGTQNRNLLPPGYEAIGEYIASASYEELADFERMSDGVFGDQIAYLEVVERQQAEAADRIAAQIEFGLEQSADTATASAISVFQAQRSAGVSVTGTVDFAINGWRLFTEEAREYAANGRGSLATDALSVRDNAIQGTARALYLEAVNGLATGEDIQQLERAVNFGNASLAPASSQGALRGLFRLSQGTGNQDLIDDFFPFISNYADQAGDYIAAQNEAAAISQANGYIPFINRIAGANPQNIVTDVQSIIAGIGSIQDLGETDRNRMIANANFAGAQGFINAFFGTSPSRQQIEQGLAYMRNPDAEGGAFLSQYQRDLLGQASTLEVASGRSANITTYYNQQGAAARNAIEAAEQARERQTRMSLIDAGAGDSTSASDRALVEDMIEDAYASALNGRPLEQVLLDPAAIADPALQPMFSSMARLNVLPEALVNQFNRVAAGDIRYVNEVLTHWTNMRNTVINGVEVPSPAVAGALSAGTIATLDYLTDAGMVSANLEEVLIQRNRFLQQSEFRERFERFLGGDGDSRTVAEYVMSIPGMSAAPPSAANAMTAAARAIFSLVPNIDRAEFDRRINEQFDRVFQDGGGIVFEGVGLSTRTSASLAMAVGNLAPVFEQYATQRIIEATDYRATLGYPSMTDLTMTDILLGSLGRTGTEGLADAANLENRYALRPIGAYSPGNVRYEVIQILPPEQGGIVRVLEDFQFTDFEGNTQEGRRPLIIDVNDREYRRYVLGYQQSLITGVERRAATLEDRVQAATEQAMP
jgi:hypothetical protein